MEVFWEWFELWVWFDVVWLERVMMGDGNCDCVVI